MRVADDQGPGLPSRYRLLARLGRGSFAQAYHCEDTEGGGEVVVKLYELRDRGWSPVTSFEREAAVLAELAHPAIPRYIAHEQLPDGRLLLVQSYAAGRSLADLLRRGRRFTDAEVADLAEQVLEVLAYLQSLNPPIIHRDLKPGNLVLDEGGRVKLVDFGSVREGFRRDGELGSTIVGTYGYMAPEQFQGRATIQSDLYGLGATLVHVLSHVAPADLPQQGLQLDFRESVKASPGMIAWLERMLEPDPRRRFADAKQALAAFRQRDAAGSLTLTKRAALDQLEPPQGSRIVVEAEDGELGLFIPRGGFGGAAARLFGFACFWLAFVAFWTMAALRGSLLFAAFSVPFWAAGIWMLSQAVNAIFGRAALHIGRTEYWIEKELWGRVERYEGKTAQLAGASLGSKGPQINGESLDGCLLYAGAQEVKLGSQLSLVERRWLVDIINRQLGRAPEEE